MSSALFRSKCWSRCRGFAGLALRVRRPDGARFRCRGCPVARRPCDSQAKAAHQIAQAHLSYWHLLGSGSMEIVNHTLRVHAMYNRRLPRKTTESLCLADIFCGHKASSLCSAVCHDLKTSKNFHVILFCCAELRFVLHLPEFRAGLPQ